MEKKKKQTPLVDKKNCAGCSVCVENCPMDCLAIEGPKFHGDIGTIAYLKEPDACIGCGICARSCPIEAIKMCTAKG